MTSRLHTQVLLGAYKNIAIKLREKKKTAIEIFYPVYFILILCGLHFTQPPVKLPLVAEFPQESLHSTFRAPSFTAVIYAPNTSAENRIIRQVQRDLSIPWLQGFATHADMAAHNGAGDSIDVAGHRVDRQQIVGVVLHSLERGHANYTIKLQHEVASLLPVTPTTRVGPDDNETVRKLMDSGILVLQRSLNYNIYGKSMHPGQSGAPDTHLERFPFPGAASLSPSWLQI